MQNISFKYVDTAIVFQEIPDEITLAINISGCPNNCKGCHSSYLKEDIGENLNCDVVKELITSNSGITCICFMGGDQAPRKVDYLAEYIRLCCEPNIKIAWYSGKSELSPVIDLNNFDYIKLGPYIPKKGPLNNRNTNQRLYEVIHYDSITGVNIPTPRLSDITYKFWKNA